MVNMGTQVSINYGELSLAAENARGVAKKLKTYSTGIKKGIYQMLISYDGENSENIIMAKNYSINKINKNETRSIEYSRYASELDNLVTRCKNTDCAVKTKISALSSQFKIKNNIPDSKVVNSFNYFLTAISTSSVPARWITNSYNKYSSFKQHIKQSIEDWWDYDGGKQLVVGVSLAVLTIAGAALALAAASTGIGFFIAAGLLLIKSANSFVNINNEFRAYNETRYNGDPAFARRRSSENTISDTLKRETDSKKIHKVGDVIDGTQKALEAAQFIADFADGFDKYNELKKMTGGKVFDFNRIKDLSTWDQTVEKYYFDFSSDKAVKTAKHISSFAKNSIKLYDDYNVSYADSKDKALDIVSFVSDTAFMNRSVVKGGLKTKDGETINMSDVIDFVKDVYEKSEDYIPKNSIKNSVRVQLQIVNSIT